jgi:hypothetical protein
MWLCSMRCQKLHGQATTTAVVSTLAPPSVDMNDALRALNQSQGGTATRAGRSSPVRWVARKPERRSASWRRGTKLCHIVALAAVGWYLMCPSLQGSCRTGLYGLLDCIDNYHSNFDEPLNEWEKLERFDLPTECKGDIPRNSSIKTGTCKCIATNDPRLKKR